MKSLSQVFRTIAILIVLTSNIGCDQISKNWVREKVEYNDQINLVKSYVTLIKVENTGAFLSLGQSFPPIVKTLLLTILPLIALAFAIVFVLTNRRLGVLSTLGICFMIG